MKEEMRIPSDEPTSKQQQAIILLARGETVKSAAKNIGVTETTIYNWKTNDWFMEDLKDEIRSYVNEARASISALLTPAIEELKNLLDSDNPNIKLKVIEKILRSSGVETLNPTLHAYREIGLETLTYEEEQREKRKQDLFQSLRDF